VKEGLLIKVKFENKLVILKKKFKQQLLNLILK